MNSKREVLLVMGILEGVGQTELVLGLKMEGEMSVRGQVGESGEAWELLK
jgi:hypothetical protein